MGCCFCGWMESRARCEAGPVLNERTIRNVTADADAPARALASKPEAGSAPRVVLKEHAPKPRRFPPSWATEGSGGGSTAARPSPGSYHAASWRQCSAHPARFFSRRHGSARASGVAPRLLQNTNFRNPVCIGGRRELTRRRGDEERDAEGSRCSSASHQFSPRPPREILCCFSHAHRTVRNGTTPRGRLPLPGVRVRAAARAGRRRRSR